LKNFSQFVVIHTVKGFGIVNKTEAEDIKKNWQQYTEELCKNIFMTQITMML